jgi:hypothetical protein
VNLVPDPGKGGADRAVDQTLPRRQQQVEHHRDEHLSDEVRGEEREAQHVTKTHARAVQEQRESERQR